MNQRVRTVVDLGSAKVVCLAGMRADDGLIDVVAASIVPCKGLRRGVVCDLDAAAESLTRAFAEIRQTSGFEVEEVAITVNGSHLESMNAQGVAPIFPKSRTIKRDDVLAVINHSRQVMPEPDREQIQAIPREFRVDGQRGVAHPIGMSGGRLEVLTHLITGHSPHLHNLERAVSMAGATVGQMVAQPVASGLGATSADAREHGCAVVDLGAGTTSLAVFSAGAVAHSAVIPLGGANVTSDLSKLLKTSPEEADRLKFEDGNAVAASVQAGENVEVWQIGLDAPRLLDRRVLCEIIESRVREIALMVKAEIERSGLMGMLPAGVILTGGGSEMDGIDRLYGEIIPSMQVRKGRPRVSAKSRLSTTNPALSGAIGLAEFAIGSDDEELTPASGLGSWKDKIRTLKALLGGKG